MHSINCPRNSKVTRWKIEKLFFFIDHIIHIILTTRESEEESRREPRLCEMKVDRLIYLRKKKVRACELSREYTKIKAQRRYIWHELWRCVEFTLKKKTVRGKNAAPFIYITKSRPDSWEKKATKLDHCRRAFTRFHGESSRGKCELLRKPQSSGAHAYIYFNWYI